MKLLLGFDFCVLKYNVNESGKWKIDTNKFTLYIYCRMPQYRTEQIKRNLFLTSKDLLFVVKKDFTNLNLKLFFFDYFFYINVSSPIVRITIVKSI